MTQDDSAKRTTEELSFFLETANDFLNAQPPASDLSGITDWLSRLNAVYASWATMNAKAQSLLARLTYHEIHNLPEDEYKKVKSSSTLTDQYVKGKYPHTSRLCIEVEILGKVLAAAGDNTRTLIASWRLEREIDAKTVRQG